MLDPLGESFGVHRALEHARPDAGVGAALGDVADEEIGHRLLRPAREEERDLVEGIDAGGHHDVQLRDLIGDPLDPPDVPALADDGDDDDRADAVPRQLAKPADGVGDTLLLVAPFLGIVLLHVGGHHEDVLVHQHTPEIGDVDGSARRLNCLFHTPHGSRAPFWCQRG